MWIDYDDYDMINVMACYECVQLWDHGKGMMMQGRRWFSCVPITMTMMCWSH